MTAPERQRMLRDLILLIALLPGLLREALTGLDDDEQAEVLEGILPDAEAAQAMLDDPDEPMTPFQPVANLCRRLADVGDVSPALAAQLGQCEQIFRRCRDAAAHGLLFPADDVQH